MNMQRLINIFSFLTISYFGIYFYLTNPKISHNFAPIYHVDCVEEEPFIFGDSFSKPF